MFELYCEKCGRKFEDTDLIAKHGSALLFHCGYCSHIVRTIVRKDNLHLLNTTITDAFRIDNLLNFQNDKEFSPELARYFTIKWNTPKGEIFFRPTKAIKSKTYSVFYNIFSMKDILIDNNFRENEFVLSKMRELVFFLGYEPKEASFYQIIDLISNPTFREIEFLAFDFE